MGDFKFSLKSMIVVALIIVCAALTFWESGQNETSFGNKNHQADFTGYAGARPTAERATPGPGKEPVMPKGFIPNAAWRDPFAAPAEITGAPVNPPPNPPGNTGGSFDPPGQASPPFTSDLPSLAGIVSSGGRQMAIIRHRGVSRAYNEGEQVGNYRLVQIAGDAVILENHTGELTVRLP